MRYVIVLGVVLLGMGAAAVRDAAPSRPAGCAGVVDMRRLLEGYGKWNDMEKLVASRRAERQKEIEALGTEVEAIAAEIEKLEAGSAEYARTQAQLIQKEALLDTTTRQYEIELGRSEDAQYRAILKEVAGAAGALAKELGLSVVVQRSFESSDGTWESALYVDPSADLTGRLLERLNKKYESEKK